MSHPELAPIAFLAAFSLVLPLPWHWRNGNVGTLSMIVWLFVLNIIYAINALLWPDQVITKALVWCDITTKIIVGGSTALPAAGLCVCIRLYNASAARGKPGGTGQRVVRIWEGVACYGIPAVFMILHYIAQGHRFDIIETFGCRPTAYFSIPGIVLVWAPPLVLSLVALVFGVLALINLFKHYRSFVINMRDADTGGYALSHYIRLMILALTQMIWATGVTAFCLAINFNLFGYRLLPYRSWDYVHWGFSAVWVFPRIEMSDKDYRILYATWCFVPASTIIFVSLNTFGEDAVVEYRRFFGWVSQHSGLGWIAHHIVPERSQGRASRGLSTFLPPLQFNHPKTTQTSLSVNVQTTVSLDPSTHSSELDLESAKFIAENVDKEHKEIC